MGCLMRLIFTYSEWTYAGSPFFNSIVSHAAVLFDCTHLLEGYSCIFPHHPTIISILYKVSFQTVCFVPYLSLNSFILDKIIPKLTQTWKPSLAIETVWAAFSDVPFCYRIFPIIKPYDCTTHCKQNYILLNLLKSVSLKGYNSV